MGVNSHFATGQKGLRSKARHYPRPHASSSTMQVAMACQACLTRAHRTHTCGRGRSLTRSLVPGQQILFAHSSAGGLQAVPPTGSASSTATTTSLSTSLPTQLQESSGDVGCGGGDGKSKGGNTVDMVAEGVRATKADSLIPAPVLEKMKHLAQNFPGIRNGKHFGTDAQKRDYKEQFGQKKLYFEFGDPDYGEEPDVSVASVRGQRIYMVRWELSFPCFNARCECSRALNGKRWQCSAASGLARPILFNGGERAWVSQWVYECPGTNEDCCRFMHILRFHPLSPSFFSLGCHLSTTVFFSPINTTFLSLAPTTSIILPQERKEQADVRVLPPVYPGAGEAAARASCALHVTRR